MTNITTIDTISTADIIRQYAKQKLDEKICAFISELTGLSEDLIFEKAIYIQGTIAEYKGGIVDIFEDFLEEEKVVLQSEDRDNAIEDGEDPEELAMIYGDAYDIIGDTIEEGYWNGSNDVNEMIDAFQEVLLEGKADYILSEANAKQLREKINQYISWWRDKMLIP